MPTEFVRLTFTVTPDMEEGMAQTKRTLFDDVSHPEMILSLIKAGLAAAQVAPDLTEQP